jgi:hypothetical protein
MKEVSRCTRCILPESLPSALLDEHGVCGHCRAYQAMFGGWEAVAEQRKSELEDLFGRAKQLKRPYDCLVPLSGGKDSTYVLYVCSKVYGLRCLCVTFDNGFLTEYARTNIQNALDATGADHLFYRINRDRLLKLYKLFLTKSGDFCSVCMRGINVGTRNAARAFNVPFVISGAAKKISYLGMAPEVKQAGSDAIFIRNVLAGEPLESEATPLLGSASRARQAATFQLRRMGLLATASKLSRAVKKVVYRSVGVPEPAVGIRLFDHLDVSPGEMYEVLRQEMGWENPVDKLEHMDCALHELPLYIHTRKFPELSMHTFYRSGRIRQGLMTREEAMYAEEDELANLEPPRILQPFLAEIGMTEEEFESSVQDWRKLGEFRSKS